MLVEGIDFNYTFPENDSNSIHINLTSGKYDGVTFKYGGVRVEERDDQGYLTFNFDIISSSGKYTKEQLLEDIDFKDLLGNFLVQVMTSNIEIEQEDIDDTQ